MRIRTGNVPPQIHNIKNKIVITAHARQRWEERVPEEERRGKKLKDIAFKARYYGVNLNCFDEDEVGNEKLYNYLNNCFIFKYASNVLRYWNGCVFVFAGKHGRTLITLLKIDENSLKKWEENKKSKNEIEMIIN